MYCSFFVFLPIIGSTSVTTLWVWTDEGKSVADEMFDNPRMIGLFPQLSFIELKRTDSTISIEFVQRGSDWPSGSSFCSHMLPAAMDEFLETGIDLKEILQMSVYMTADPFIAGCKCYLRLFVSMGYNTIGNVSLQVDDDIVQLCEMLDNNGEIVATPIEHTLVSHPPVSIDAMKDLSRAFKYTVF